MSEVVKLDTPEGYEAERVLLKGTADVTLKKRCELGSNVPVIHGRTDTLALLAVESGIVQFPAKVNSVKS